MCQKLCVNYSIHIYLLMLNSSFHVLVFGSQLQAAANGLLLLGVQHERCQQGDAQEPHCQ